MANQLSNLKSQLLTSGLQNKDQPLFQIINQLISYLQSTTDEVAALSSGSSGGGSAAGITALTTDVVAVGPGSAVATIQPNAVTYPKLQNTLLSDVLLGRGNPSGQIGEIQLGANLQISGDTLEITTSGGGSGGGLTHNFLSPTHPDTVPATAVLGDLVYAADGPAISGDYYGFFLNSPVVEDFVGIRVGYMSGYHGTFIPTNSMGFCPPDIPIITSVPPDINISLDDVDGYILSSLVENFSGIRSGYTFTDFPVVGNYFAYYPPALAFIAPPSPTPPTVGGLWRRLPIDTAGKVLTVVSGIPSWASLPPIPAEPAYPWQDITFNAADFTATGGVTPLWTVSSGNVQRWQYQQFPGTAGVGNNVRIAFYAKNTSVSGSAPTQLQITLPFNILGKFGLFISLRENNLPANNGGLFYDAGTSTNQLFIEKVPFGTVFDTTANETYVAFEISAVLAP